MKMKKSKGKRGSSRLRSDRRRKHRHWQVTVYYADGEKFARVYIDRDKAASFAQRQKRSPVVKSARVLEVD
ncbi:MAG TPA: hypothetical protein VJN21_12730 [Candidatus Acidoferrales bacterium]|nr:hypothetical protein [Candidatus Acidoferrales bacterium]